jgi:hypothetical protein
LSDASRNLPLLDTDGHLVKASITTGADANWFSIPNTDCEHLREYAKGFSAIDQITQLCDGGEIDETSAKKILTSAKKLAEAASNAKCPFLSAAAINTLKRVPFLKPRGEVELQISSLVPGIWRQIPKLGGQKRGHDCDIYHYLAGWESGLQNVNPRFYADYLVFLALDEVRAHVNFSSAAWQFRKRVSDYPPTDLVLSKVACAFISDILAHGLGDFRFMEQNLLVGVDLALQSAAKGCFDALAELPSVVRQFIKQHNIPNWVKGNPNWSRPPARRQDPPNLGFLWQAYLRMNEFRRRCAPPATAGAQEAVQKWDQNRWCMILAELMPLTGGYDPRERRRKPDGWEGVMSDRASGLAPKLRGKVVDVTPDGRGYHIKLTSKGTCGIASDNGFVPQMPIKCSSIPLTLQGFPQPFVLPKTIDFLLETGDQDTNLHANVDEAWVLRGFNYEDSFGNPNENIGVLVWVRNCSDKLRSKILTLPQIVDSSSA